MAIDNLANYAPAPGGAGRSWGISNFKAFEHARADLAHVTVLAGANSSGKSTYLQSLLFLAQSIDEGRTVMNGSLVRLGAAEDVLHDEATSTTLNFGFDAQPRRVRSRRGQVAPVRRVELQITLAKLAQKERLAVTQVEILVDGERVLFARSPSSSSLESVPSGLRAPQVRTATEESRLLHVKEFGEGYKPRQTFLVMSGLVPSAFVVGQRKGSARSMLREQLARLIQTCLDSNGLPADTVREEVVDAIFSDPEFSADLSLGELTEYIDQVETVSAKRLTDVIDRAADLTRWKLQPLRQRALAHHHSGRSDSRDRAEVPAQAAAIAANGIEELAVDIAYLGPLRDEPRMVSPVGAGGRHLVVGVRGEFTASLLSQRGESKITYYRPDRTRCHGSLLQATAEWVRHLGVGDGVNVSGRGKLGHTMQVVVNGAERDLTAIGVGASQVLPAVVAVLAAQTRDVLLLEQPELHLHPAVQARLGDLFLFARPDVSVIVETHSEHLVRRIRLRVAQRAAKLDDCAIYFAASESEGASKLRRVTLGPNGSIEDWPAGFFDVAESETIALMRAARTHQVDG